MAALTVGAEFSVVHIVAAMALAASHRQFDHVFYGLPMAVVARNRRMRTFQLEICLQVMVEEPDLPVHRVVAAFASGAEPAFVGIIVVMAIHTLGFDVFEYL